MNFTLFLLVWKEIISIPEYETGLTNHFDLAFLGATTLGDSYKTLTCSFVKYITCRCSNMYTL